LITPVNIEANRILVDTDVVSYLLKEDTRAEFFKPYLIHKTVAVSFITVAELYYWAYSRSWGQSRITEMESKIKNYLVLPYDYMLCQCWAQIYQQCEAKGFTIPKIDCWIAATAKLYECALATNNRRHFKHIDNLTIICPSLI